MEKKGNKRNINSQNNNLRKKRKNNEYNEYYNINKIINIRYLKKYISNINFKILRF